MLGQHSSKSEHLTRLRRRRIELALTQSQLAILSGVNAKTISRLENQFTEPHPTTLAKLAKALQCLPIELLGPAAY